jgi:hypothetical protein
MDRRPSAFWRRVRAWGIVPLAVAAQAAESPGPQGGREKVSVRFNLLATPREGATSPMASMGPIYLGVGEAMVSNGSVQPFAFGAAGDPGGCSVGLAIQSVEQMLAGYPVAWSADVRVDDAAPDRLLLSGRWERFTRGASGKAERAAGASMPRISLREGERVLLDLVAPPSSEGRDCMRNFALELTAEVAEDPALASRQIAYDLWLVHETREGQESAVRSQLTASQGEQVSFAFPRRPLPALAGGGADGQTLQVTFTGKVRGRARTDGTIAISLETMRSLSYVAPDGSNDGGITEAGAKVVEVRPGEAVRVEVPDPGYGVAASDPRASRMAQDLAGHSFAIVCRVRPLS